MQEIKIGYIGAWGFRGKLAKYAMESREQVKVVAGADPSFESLRKFQEFYGKDTFVTRHYKDIVSCKDINAVFICSPDFCHEKHAVAALKAGKAVYLEKPIATTLQGADRILKTAMQTKSKLYIGHNMRYFPSILKMKQVIDSGGIGEIRAVWCRHFISYGGDAYFKDWHSERKNVTGLLVQKGAHDIDIIHWLANGFTTRVVGMGGLSVYNRCRRRNRGEKQRPVSFNPENWPPLENRDVNPVIDVEDHSMILMELDNGVQASYLQCLYTPDAVRNYTFIGTKGRVENFGDYGRCQVAVYTKRHDYYKEPDTVYQLEEVSGSHGGSDPEVVNAFIDFIREGKAPNTSPVAARNAVAAGVRGTESLRCGDVPKDVPQLDLKIAEYFEKGQKT